VRVAVLLQAAAFAAFAGIAGAQQPPLGSSDFAPTRDRPFGWRGDGSGRFPGATPPTVWSLAKNLRWSTSVGSAFSSPILTDKLVVVASEPNQLIGLDREDGKVRWKVEINPDSLDDETSRASAAGYVPRKDGSGLMAATPLTDGETVYAVLGNGIVCAVDLEGKRKWTSFIDADENTGYGRSASPLLVAGKLIVHMTNLYAFEPRTGKRLWVNPETESKYGSPTFLRAAGTELIVTPAGDAVRVRDGKLVESGMGSATYTSPVVHEGIVYFGEVTFNASRLDAKLKVKELWSGPGGGEVFGSPLLHDGLLFTATGKGKLFVYAATGMGDRSPLVKSRSLFDESDRSGPQLYASVTLAGRHLFLNSTQGEIIVLEATREAKLVSRTRLSSGSGSSPVFSGERMFIRDGEKLLCVSR
jgi:outer membrane protein assembly factor BamB